MVPAVLLAVLALAGPSAQRPSGDESAVLVQLRPAVAPTAALTLVRAGARLVAPELNLWRLPAAHAAPVTRSLRARDALAHVQPDRPAGALATTQVDPLSDGEWWRGPIGVEGLTPPGPGRPVTIVDSGIDVTHPEFAGRPNTILLNAQEPAGIGGEHGTAVASVVGAPANGAGIVGIYPEAVLQSWDAAVGRGTQLETSEIVAGILAGARTGPGVINLSLGGPEREPLIEQAADVAFAKGSLIVAASGNDGETGSPLGYPAALPHVLTVASTGRDNTVSSFSTESRFVDLSAPGEDMVVATALGKGWLPGVQGTSFSAPLVSGAAAWVWSARPRLDNTQLFEVMRRSARDIGPPGRDDGTGFGLLDVSAALAYPAPALDPFEPNEDLEFVKPDGFFAADVPAFTTRERPSSRLRARLDRVEDPRDVYRIYLPARKKVLLTLSSSTDVDMSVWSSAAISVQERPGKLRLGVSAKRGTGNERIVLAAGRAGRIAYVAVGPGKGVREADYGLAVRAR